MSQRIDYVHSPFMPTSWPDRPRTGKEHVIKTPANEAGARLDRLIANTMGTLSRSRVKALIEAGEIHEIGPDGRRATIKEPAYRVKQDQSFAIFIPEASPAIPQGQPIALDIHYEDAAIIVIDKPAGLVVHPAPGNPDGTLVNALIAHCGDALTGIGGVRRPGIVHRLDKETSGLMVAAKTDAAHAALTAQFAARTVTRRYVALAWGVPTPPRGEITGNIGRSPRNRKKMAVLSHGGKPARTRYRVLRTFGAPKPAVSLLALRLATGRTHQIRVHLAHRGHPVLGDPVYGGGHSAARRGALGPAADAAASFARQALHAETLGFTHPISGEPLEFLAKIPNDISNLIDSLEMI